MDLPRPGDPLYEFVQQMLTDPLKIPGDKGLTFVRETEEDGTISDSVCLQTSFEGKKHVLTVAQISYSGESTWRIFRQQILAGAVGDPCQLELEVPIPLRRLVAGTIETSSRN